MFDTHRGLAILPDGRPDNTWNAVHGPYATLPARLEDVAPGPVLGAFLAGVDARKHTGGDRLSIITARSRLIAHHQVKLLEELAAIRGAFDDASELDPADAFASASLEIGATLRLTSAAADRQLHVAIELVERLPQVLDALRQGFIDLRCAEVIVDGTSHLEAATARLVADKIIDEAHDLTTGQIRARVRKLCAEAEPRDAEDRYRTAHEQRSVVGYATDAGTATIAISDVAPDTARAMIDRVDSIARDLRGPEETRTMDQLRCDVICDLVLGRPVSRDGDLRHQGSIDLVVDIETLARLADHAGDLAGYGPIVADIARQVAQNGTDMQWLYTVTNPDTGTAIATGTTRRRPEAAMRRRVTARFRTCMFPGCRRSALDSDLDHTNDWAKGGTTTDENLVPLCRRHHRAKHLLGWSYRQIDGRIVWTSPLGRTYVTSGTPP